MDRVLTGETEEGTETGLAPPAGAVAPRIASFSNTYARLPAGFFVRQLPTPVAAPSLVQFNHPLADELGVAVGDLDGETLAAILAGNLVPEGAEPISMAYAGHQFGGFVPRLGDGRAILMGEVVDRAGRRRDIQWKGAGPTPFSRRGDGRAALGPVLREYLVGEAMHAMGIPATRALAAVATGEAVFRDSALPGAVLVRVAASHVRVGTFQYFAGLGDLEATQRLADYVIDRHDPQARQAERPYLALLQSVARRQAELVARWMGVGFVHGVMNTDNMAVSGETIDFGPCAFLEAYDPATVFSSIDSHGRYAYGAQAHAARWNIARLTETLLPFLDADPERALGLGQGVIDAFPGWFEAQWLDVMAGKLGLATRQEGDRELVDALLGAMQANQADFTLTFRRLCDAVERPGEGNGPRTLFADPVAFDAWEQGWRQRLQDEPAAAGARAMAMRAVNPAYIPRNHQVERVIQAAVERGELEPFRELLAVLSLPFEEQPARADYALPALMHERVDRTFCGT